MITARRREPKVARIFGRLLILGPIAAALLVSCGAADNYPRQPGVDVLHYTFRITLRDDVDEIEGTTTVDMRFLEAGISHFTLDLASAAKGKGMSVSSVTMQGAPATFEHQDDRLRITVEPVSKTGERRSFTVAYHGIPSAGLRIGKNLHGERTFFSDNWPDQAHRWLPMVDHPSDKATSEFHVTAPSRYQVVSNGLLQEEMDLGDGRRLTHWKQSVPIATWLNALGVAQFSSHHAAPVRGIPLQSWVFHQDREKAVPAHEDVARRVLEFYIEHIGPFPYEKLGGVQAAGLGGGMELASAIFYGERNILGRGVDSLVAHEVAHQWFGDAVTECDWDHIWLSEGFATYFALLFLEHDKGRDAFAAGLKRSREIVLATEKRNPKLAVIHDNLTDTRHILNRLVYEKGSWFLHMLRGRVGTTKFWAGIREYYRRHRDGNVSTDDFRRVMEETSGQDLGPFFQQWLNRPGSPEIEGNWHYRPDDRRVEIMLKQVQPVEPFKLSIQVAILADGSDRPRIETLDLNERTQQFEFSCEKAPVSVTLDPDCWVLMKATFGPRPTAPAQPAAAVSPAR